MPGSTPVASFGDVASAWAATLGINPSAAEFTEDGGLLASSRRRLATLDSLGASRCDQLTDAQADQVIADCAAYFSRRPYRWFSPLDQLLRASLGASFHDGTACHLDLVQWATDPAWSQITDPTTRQVLLDDGLPWLRRQLAREKVTLVLLNGRTVTDHVQTAGLAQLSDAGTLPLGRVGCRLYAGTAGSVRYLGWSANLQSSFGVTNDFRNQLAQWITEHAHPGHVVSPSPPGGPGRPGRTRPAAGDAHVARGTVAEGKQELAVLLEDWYRHSSAPTIGDVGSYGRTACIRIRLGSTTAVLNSDTRRAAVRDYLTHVRAHTADASWRVIANRNGRLNKLTYTETGDETPGWYCYLTTETTTPTTL